jgi:hypothetical protein
VARRQSDALAENAGPRRFARSSGPQPELERRLSGASVAESEATFRALDLAVPKQDELAADEALQAGASHQRHELLVERAIEGVDLGHEICLNTPITLPRI